LLKSPRSSRWEHPTTSSAASPPQTNAPAIYNIESVDLAETSRNR
jgi:hypothetical protein